MACSVMGLQAITPVLLAGCASTHSALRPGGPRAREIAELMVIFFGVSAVVYLVIIGVLVWAIFRERPKAWFYSRETAAPLEDHARRLVTGAAVVAVVLLTALALADFFVQRSLSAHPANALRVVVTGHQYWWEVEYDDPVSSRRLRTANELHIPVDQPVELVLTSRDVVHSFWMPSLTGKRDLIPGYTSTEVLIANRPGMYTGQCAEFCGLQHARMRITVHAHEPEQFQRWKRNQLAPARPPTTFNERRGRDIFVKAGCAACHVIQGAPAQNTSVQGATEATTLGPELTHLASRRSIAAGTLRNNRTNLASWVHSPQRIKPGARMPPTPLSPAELAALTTYLASLE